MTSPRRASPPGRWLWLALGWAVAARAAYLFFYASDPLYGHLLHDAKRYHEWAQAWAEGRAWEPGPFYQAPLYPWLLSLVYRIAGPEPRVAYILQLLLGCLTVFLVYRIASRIGGPRAGAAAGALAALHGTFIFHEAKLLPTSLATFLGALLVDRLQSASLSRTAVAFLIAGLSLGGATTAHPSFLLAAPLVLAWILADRERGWRPALGRAAWFLLGTALIVSPVTARNVLASGEAVLVSANGGVTFYQGNHPGARGVYATPEGFSGSIFKQRDESRALAEREAGRRLSDGEASSFWFRKGLKFALARPAGWLALEGRKLLLALSSAEIPLEYHPRLDRNPARWLAPVPFALVLALAALRPLTGRRLSQVEIPVALVLGTVLATLLLFYVSSRYRLPALPALLAVAGCGVAAWWETLRTRPRRALPAALVAIVVGGGSAAFVTITQPDLLAVLEARGLADLGEAHLASGSGQEAAALYRRAAALDPRDAYARLDLAKALRATGDAAGAERELKETLRLAPALAEARYDLGVLLFGTDRLGEAAVEFRAAFRLDPSSVHAANNLLGTLLQLGRAEEALAVHEEMVARGLPVDPPLAAWVRSLGP